MPQLPSYLPPPRGDQQAFGTILAGMPLLRCGALFRMDTALWLPNHRHACAELHYVHRGRLEVELPPAAGRRLVAAGGWFMLTAPRRVHRARDGIMPPVHLVWLQLDPTRRDACRGTPFDSAGLARLCRVLHARRDSAWPAPAEAAAVFRRMAALLPGSGDPLLAAAVRAALAELLILATQPAAERAVQAALQRGLAALAAEPPCTVAAAARAAGMSPGSLHARCAEHLGTTPAAWQLARRLDRARERLTAGDGVATVARSLGFTSPRYFAHAFRREVGISPSQYADMRQRVSDKGVLEW
jgi:AraC-like DNA-binding protein